MAQLSSPGASVTVIDESFYTPAAPGTTPLIIVASQENKANSAGTGIATGTLKANAGKVYLLTSQMDLGSTFGIPYFQTDANNNPVHAGEVNEYGLQAAYSFLGVSNRAYVVRADLDTKQLEASANAPTGLPTAGEVWLDTASTKFGIFEWNAAAATAGGQTFTVKTPTVITDAAKASGGLPITSVGAIGDYAIVAVVGSTDPYTLCTKTTAGTWVAVGTPEWAESIPTVTGTTILPGVDLTGKTFTINGTPLSSATTVGGLVTALNGISGVVASFPASNKLTISTSLDELVLTGGDWTTVGITPTTYRAPALLVQPHTSVPQWKANLNTSRPTGSVWIKTTVPNQGASYSVKTYNDSTGLWVENIAPLYETSAAALVGLDTAGGLNIAAGKTYVQYSTADTGATFEIFKRSRSGVTSLSSKAGFTSTSGTIVVTESQLDGQLSAEASVSIGSADTASELATAFAAAFALAGFTHAVVDVVAGVLVITHTAGGDLVLSGTPVTSIFAASTNFYAVGDTYVASQWVRAGAFVGVDAPTGPVADGQLWYNSTVSEVDIMAHDGNTWVGYKNAFPDTDPAGPQVKAIAPKKQSDGETDLAEGDLWISTADLENYPMIYRFTTDKWVLLDNGDQTTENGVLFADARSGTSGGTATVAPTGTIAELLTSDFLDTDAPDPALYPQGMILWNLRRSGNNVLQYVENFVDLNADNVRMGDESQATYYPNRWITDAPNATNGAGQFGRKAQRAVVLKALNALIQSNQQIRDEDSRVFNIMSCPGYLETLPALNALNADRGLLSFVVADAPARLAPDATTLSNWGNNVDGATGDGEVGLVSTDAYSAVYYPWGLTTDLIGNNIAVPPSHIMLRTIALSDNVSYEWFAPAGTRRGGVTNASSVGYITVEGEFQTVALNNGQRDVLAAIHVNPITYLGGIGLVAYGQKTRQLVASALDRINVARLVIHLRYQLNAIAKPYIFEPNDTITRNEIKQQVESLMLELTGQRALYDYLVVCDTSNNTPSRIDRNELHVDIAIEPVKAVEFIYIPLRLENTGAIKGLGA